MIDRGPITSAVRAILTAATGRPCGLGTLPLVDGRPAPLPYTVLYPLGSSVGGAEPRRPPIGFERRRQFMVGFGRKSQPLARQAVGQHYLDHFGEPFSVLVEDLGKKLSIEIPGFADTPDSGLVTLATNGLSGLARKYGFLGEGGQAQELIMVIGGEFLNDEFLDFFVRLALVYAQGQSYIDWNETMRLSSDIPGSGGMRYLLSTPAAVFDETVSFVEDEGGTTVLCMLLPLYEEEAHQAMALGVEGFHKAFEDADPQYWNLRRPKLALA